MANAINFTTSRLKQLKNATNKDVEYKDSGQKGLIVRISPAGLKTFRLKAWNRQIGKTHQMVIGRFPEMTISDARDKTKELLSEIAKGVDIQAERSAFKKEQTLDQLFTYWLENHAKQEKKTWREDKSRYDLYLKNHLGSKKISEISPDTIRKWRNKILLQKKERGSGTIAPATVNRAFAIINTIYNKCCPLMDNPCRDVNKFHEESRDVFLKKDELNALFLALENDETPDYVKDYVKIFLFTGARRENVLSMKWCDIDITSKLWLIPGNQSKNKRSMPVYLADEVVHVLKNRKEKSTSKFVLPGTGKTGHLVEPKRAWKSLLKRAGLDTSIRLHDLRRTHGSWQAITGASSKIIGASLGHKSEQSTAVYARLTQAPIQEAVDRAISAMTSQEKKSEED